MCGILHYRIRGHRGGFALAAVQTIGIMLALSGSRAFARDDKLPTPLHGTWEVTACAINGKPFVDRKMSHAQFTFSANELIIKPWDDKGRERFRVRFEEGSSPPAYFVTRIEPANRPQQGWEIYELKGDRLRLAFMDALKGRPATFEPKPKVVILELKRVVSAGKPAK